MSTDIDGAKNAEKRELRFTVLGRTVEHFGVQMYKRRDVALAEFVANAWDAGSTTVDVQLPDPETYSQGNAVVRIEDNGRGMSLEEVADGFLVLGRNRRATDGAEIDGRPLMGRKGIGKLAGFGLGREMVVRTWRDGYGIEFTLALDRLLVPDGKSTDAEIPWEYFDPPADVQSGTVVTLKALKHASPLRAEDLQQSLARRFARRVRGEMKVRVNGKELPDPTPELDKRFPEEGFTEATVNGSVVRYWYGFAKDAIRFRDLRGFAIMSHGRVAQAPPYLFDVEGTASGQHSVRYLIGEIEADFLDDGVDDADRIATDRQELDWEDESLEAFRAWGQELSRKALRECAEFRGARTAKWVLADPDLEMRINALPPIQRKEVLRFVGLVGPAVDEEADAKELASTIVRAFEYQIFHDAIAELEPLSGDPERLREALERLGQWQVLESRAILEVIGGRLRIIDKFGPMVALDAPEVAPAVGGDNLHDLLGRFPWLLNPEWQILAEETTITKQLRDWAVLEVDEDTRDRFDFLALGDSRQIVVVELKRPGHALELADMHQVERYKERLARSMPKHEFHMVLVYGGGENVSAEQLKLWEEAPDRELRKWGTLFERSRREYERYRAVLEGLTNDGNFSAVGNEVAQARQVLDSGSSYRPPAERTHSTTPPPSD